MELVSFGLQILAPKRVSHTGRLATTANIAASVAHEINQLIGAARNNAHAALGFLPRERPDPAEAIVEVIKLVRGELFEATQAGRVQLQQVVRNLIVNAIGATSTGDGRAREPVVSTESSPAEGLLVAVGDSGRASLRRIATGLSSPLSPGSPRDPSWGPMAGDCGSTSMSRVAPVFLFALTVRL